MKSCELIVEPRKARKQKGQVMILMAVMLTTLVIMFGFVVAMGHMVHTKITMQNAVDLSAMSSASWQARYLNGVSQINWRMRQNYKWTLFDLYVTQSRFNKAFIAEVQRGSSNLDNQQAAAAFGVCQQNFGYDPSPEIGENGVGSAVGNLDHYCRNTPAPGTAFTPIPPLQVPILVSINPAIIAQHMALRAIARRLREICSVSGDQNGRYLEYAINERFIPIQQFQLRQLQIISDAFGEQMSDSGAAWDAARLTFTSNLNGALNNGNMVLENITPTQNKSLRTGDYFVARPTFRGFPFVLFEESGGGCIITIQQAGSRGVGEAIAGFSRAPRSPILGTTVQARGTPSLLFWPRGLEPPMAAVASAKPFGSRIGPEANYIRAEAAAGPYLGPNISIAPGEIASHRGPTMPGIGNRGFLRTVLGGLPFPSSGRRNARPLGGGAMNAIANSPTLHDAAFYNVIPGGTFFPGDTMRGILETNGDYIQKDRGGGGPRHYFSTLSAPGFATNNQVRSSWAPPSESGRSGYQIKLVNTRRACAEYGSSGGTSISNYCLSSDAWVNH